MTPYSEFTKKLPPFEFDLLLRLNRKNISQSLTGFTIYNPLTLTLFGKETFLGRKRSIETIVIENGNDFDGII